tara:strand:+ start:659 stop:1099 length:441 start_codon:yes stop_codon:yes gene_type:complete
MRNTNTLNYFIADYCTKANTTLEELKSKTRKRDVVEKRMIIAYVLRVKVGLTLIHTGNCLNKDHATVIHYIKTTERFLDVYPHIKRLYNSAVDSYNEFKEKLNISYNMPPTRDEKETKLVDILLEKNEKLQTKIIKLEQEIYDNKI